MPEYWKLNTQLIRSILKIAAPAVLQFLIATASWSALARVTAGFGSVGLAGYVIGFRVIIFALLPSAGLSNAAATLVGQNLGAGQPERAEKSVWRAAFFNAIFLGTVGLLFVLFSRSIVGIFTNEPEVIHNAENCLHIVAYGFVFYAFGMVLETSFNGAGDTKTPTYLNLFIFWLLEIPLAIVLAYNFSWIETVNSWLGFRLPYSDQLLKIDFGLGLTGVFWAVTIAFSVLAVVAGILFHRGKWKEKKV